MLEPTIDAGSYQNKLYTAPVSSDGGILYYRKDLVPTPPKTWDEMMDMCSIAKANNIGCYSGQFKQYEGLTVNASEAINSAGGSVLDDAGKPSLTTSEAEEGLNTLVEAFANGNIPAEAITYQEEESRRAFQSGQLLFHRNWPYVYNLATTEGSSVVKDVLGMTALPGKDGPGASSLGGHNAAISVYSKNKATARDFVKFLIEEEQQKFFATQGSLAPVIGSLYEDQELVAKLPYLPVLKTSIENAVPRPVTPFYPAVTQAIQENSYAALKGEKSAKQALEDMQKSIESAGAGS
jgi:multiple sugar transport system substrate-binding protein